MAYSDKFKAKVLKAIGQGATQQEVSKRFKVSSVTIRKWMPGSEPSVITPSKRMARKRIPRPPAIQVEDNQAARLAVENARLRMLVVDTLLSVRHHEQ